MESTRLRGALEKKCRIGEGSGRWVDRWVVAVAVDESKLEEAALWEVNSGAAREGLTHVVSQ